MTLIEIIYEYAFLVYHYGKPTGLEFLQDLNLDTKVIRLINLSVDENGNLLQGNNDDGDFIFLPWGWKQDIYRPNDSRRPTLAAQKDPRVN